MTSTPAISHRIDCGNSDVGSHLRFSIGKREFGAAARNDAAWWWTYCTRTSLVALAELGDELAKVGDLGGAAKCYRAVFEMDPMDRLGTRMALEIEKAGSVVRP